eukprot:58287_1
MILAPRVDCCEHVLLLTVRMHVVGCKLLFIIDCGSTSDDFDRYSVLIRGMISYKDEVEDLSGKELRDKNDSMYRLRKENARIFKTLALCLQQNVIKEEQGKTAVHLFDIDMNDVAKLQRYPQPDWSK